MRVNEVFETIQGEATYTGVPSVFVRTQYCPVACPWCDTKHTWVASPASKASWNDIAQKQADSDRWAEISPAALLEWAQRATTARHLVITGGEPLHDEDTPELADVALKSGWSVQIEASGTAYRELPSSAWLTLSPKIDMPGGYQIIRKAIQRANEIKMPVGSSKDIDKLDCFLAEYQSECANKTIWLQPLSQSPKATKLAIEVATKRNWRISIQTHKYLNLR